MATNPQVATDDASNSGASSDDLPTPDIHNYDRSDAETRRKLFVNLLDECGHHVELPAADRRLPLCGRLLSLDDLSDTSDADAFVDPYEVKKHFLQIWTNVDPDPSGNSTGHFAGAATGWISWNDYHIYTTPGTPGWKAGWATDVGQKVLLHTLISSQLLLYRLIALFGMPRPDDVNNMIDGFKSIWSYTLYWKPGPESQDQGDKTWFNISDYKGSIQVFFCGPSEASRSALDLLEWLVSDKVPHTYDGVLAGNIALCGC